MSTIIVVIVIVVGLAILAALLYFGLRSGGVRRDEFRRIKEERDLALAALDEIDTKADDFRDLESVLAPAVRGIIRTNREKRAQLR